MPISAERVRAGGSVLRAGPLPLPLSARIGATAAPGPMLPGAAGREAWFGQAVFGLMAAVHDHCAAPGDPAPLAARAEAILSALEAHVAPETGAEAEFLGARTLFAVLASADLAGLPGIAPRSAGLVGRFARAAPDGGDPLKLSTRNNHVLMKAAALGLYGILAEEPAAWAEARAGYARYLGSLSPEGIPVHEAVRGASAGWYCNLAVMLIVRFQSMALRHEGSLPEAEAARLALAVGALGRIAGQPELLHPWSRRNMYPHPAHGTDPFAIDTGFLRGYHRSRHYLAWVPLFEALQGAEALPAAIAAAARGSSDHFPKGSEFIGGFADLMCAPPPG
ncbi:alginate lyase family protein [Poseidonocella sp. HB161398]|uniref:alginate lyase family protein n=1 Tax=Poseidonocella sp. HB161398 TaxID=2320855 RepID=UPI0014874602|nr:alginate lyase family protein [Poseidonocella sp. HB161398]